MMGHLHLLRNSWCILVIMALWMCCSESKPSKLTNAKESAPATTSSSLKFVQILFRHGERTPEVGMPSQQIDGLFEEGRGQMTNMGYKQLYQLGQFYQNIYGDFIGDYSPNTVLVNSSNYDRTLLSAYSFLAGFFKRGSNKPKLFEDDQLSTWEPIPVHSLGTDEDLVLRGFKNCDKYKELEDNKFKNHQFTALKQKYRDIIQKIIKHGGYENYDIIDSHKFYNLIWFEKKLGILPDWVDDEIYEGTQYMNEVYESAFMSSKLQQTLGIGELLRATIYNIENVISRISSSSTSTSSTEHLRVNFLSAHQETVAGLVQALGRYDVLENKMPKFGGSVVIELHQNEDYQASDSGTESDDKGNNPKYFVKIFSKEGSFGEFETTISQSEWNKLEIKIPGNENEEKCAYSKMKRRFQNLMSDDIQSDCAVKTSEQEEDESRDEQKNEEKRLGPDFESELLKITNKELEAVI